METSHLERRTACASDSVCAGAAGLEQLVRQAIVLQACVGTRGAVEYMKAHRIHGSVIGRVLSGGAIRDEDRLSRDQPVAWD